MSTTFEGEGSMRAMMIISATAVLGMSTAAMGDVLYSQSFENTDALGAKYFDTGDATVAHDLVNNEGQAWVDIDGMDGGYIPFDPAGVGLTDGDYVGVTNYGPGGYEGDQSYQMSDTDGIMTLTSNVFDTAEYVSLAIFIADTGYEDTDWITISMGGSELYSLGGGDDGGLAMEEASGSWIVFSAEVSGGALEIAFACNSGSEALYIDSISIEGAAVPAPAALALLGLAGFARRRRR
jgi:MYXO-CTERM domain-containing protein